MFTLGACDWSNATSVQYVGMFVIKSSIHVHVSKYFGTGYYSSHKTIIFK